MKKYKLLIAILIILSLAIIIFVNKPYKSTDDYLKRNYSDLNLQDEGDFSGLDILSKDIKDKKVILTGEYHNLAQNHVVELKLLKYFQKEIGVNYYLGEYGYADSYFLNKYLESGDETILEKYFNIYKGQKHYTEEHYNYYINLYKFNQTLPKKKRIKAIGVDIESQVTYDYLIDVLKDEANLTNELKILIDELEEFNYMSQDSYKNILGTLNKLNKDIEMNEDKYKNILKEEFEGFKLAIKNLTCFSKANAGDRSKHNNMRDKYIYENFKAIDSNLEDAIYFGQWGSYHIFQDTIYHGHHLSDIDFFASLLNKDAKYKGKILSINYGYYSEKFTPQKNHYDINKDINKDLFKDFLNSESEAYIFKLNSRKSPFEEETINPFDTDVIDYKENPITNYFQYLILIRNSEKSKFVK